MNYIFEWFRPYKNKNILEHIKLPIQDDHLSMGKYTKLLEKKLQKLLRVKYVVLTNSGTSALMMAAIALNINNSSKVLIPNLSWIATNNPILILDSKFYLYDSNKDRESINYASINKCILKHKPNFVILPHLNGECHYNSQFDLLKQKLKFKIIEDSAQSFPIIKNKKIFGTKYEISCFSLSITKIINMVYGGFCTTNSKALYDRLVSIRSNGVGYDYNHSKYTHINGLNFKTSDIHSSIGLANLKEKKKIIKNTINVYKSYIKYLKNPKIRLLKFDLKNDLPTYVQAIVSSKSKFNNFCNKNKVQIHLGLNTMNKIKKFKINDSYPNSEFVSDHLVRLPSGPGYTDSEIKSICKILNLF